MAQQFACYTHTVPALITDESDIIAQTWTVWLGSFPTFIAASLVKLSDQRKKGGN